jgi:hypothetical protein
MLPFGNQHLVLQTRESGLKFDMCNIKMPVRMLLWPTCTTLLDRSTAYYVAGRQQLYSDRCRAHWQEQLEDLL